MTFLPDFWKFFLGLYLSEAIVRMRNFGLVEI